MSEHVLACNKFMSTESSLFVYVQRMADCQLTCTHLTSDDTVRQEYWVLGKGKLVNCVLL
jgi:hypothetical protein